MRSRFWTVLRARAALATAFAAILMATAIQPAEAGPGDDPFYQQPLPDAPGEPGDIIDSRPARFTLDPLFTTPVPGVNSWQVMYRSSDAVGEPIAVSGTVLVPERAWRGRGDRPIVSYAVGTRGLGDDCAPSQSLSNGTDYEGLFIHTLLQQGWAVAVTDYQGLGTPGTHTYMVGPAQGHAVLDMARAAQRLDDAGLSSDAPVGLMGYSQGGGSTGWATELAPDYAPELSIRGAAMGGVPGDLTATAEFLDGSLFVAFALMTALGFDAAYPELDLESHLNERGRQLAADGENTCLASLDGFSLLINTAFRNIDDYVTTNPLDTPEWQARLNGAQLGSVAPQVPVFQYHGVVDEIVPYRQARDLRRTWCDSGTRVTWAPLPGEHVLAMAEGFPLAVGWMSARFAGLPTLGNCLLP